MIQIAFLAMLLSELDDKRVGNNIDVNGKTAIENYGKHVDKKMTYVEAVKRKRVNNFCNRENLVLTNLN